MSIMVERVARAMYLDRVNPDLGDIVLDVAVAEWSDLPDEHRPGIQVWHCKRFWRDAARVAIAAMREPTEAMWEAGELRWHGGGDWQTPAHPYLEDIATGILVWQRAIDAALTD